jgi:hypothetical protein
MTALTEIDWGRIFAKAWTDPAFKAAYEADPRAALRSYAAELDVDPDASFSFPPMPAKMDDATIKAMAEGSAHPQPMYCC